MLNFLRILPLSPYRMRVAGCLVKRGVFKTGPPKKKREFRPGRDIKAGFLAAVLISWAWFGLMTTGLFTDTQGIMGLLVTTAAFDGLILGRGDARPKSKKKPCSYWMAVLVLAGAMAIATTVLAVMARGMSRSGRNSTTLAEEVSVELIPKGAPEDAEELLEEEWEALRLETERQNRREAKLHKEEQELTEERARMTSEWRRISDTRRRVNWEKKDLRNKLNLLQWDKELNRDVEGAPPGVGAVVMRDHLVEGVIRVVHRCGVINIRQTKDLSAAYRSLNSSNRMEVWRILMWWLYSTEEQLRGVGYQDDTVFFTNLITNAKRGGVRGMIQKFPPSANIGAAKIEGAPPIREIPGLRIEYRPTFSEIMERERAEEAKKEGESGYDLRSWDFTRPGEFYEERLVKQLKEEEEEEEVKARAKRDVATRTERTIRAFDCSVPQHSRTVKPSGSPTCENANVIDGTRQNKTYLILQRVGLKRIRIRSCKIIQTRIVNYCGNYDHETFMPNYSHFGKTLAIPYAECERLWDEKTMVLQEGEDQPQIAPLQAPGISDVTVQITGKTWLDPGYDAQCVGGKYKFDGKEYEDLIITDHKTIVLEMSNATVDENGVVVVVNEQRALACRFAKGKCRNEQRTYLWPPTIPREEQCGYMKVRVSSGVQWTTTEHEKLFVSRGNEMVRLVIKDPASVCGYLAFRTNYDSLIITEDLKAPPFQRELDPNEVSIVMYSNMKDDFLYGAITAYVREELTKLLREDCEREAAEREQRYSLLATRQQATINRETIALGEGFFATATGEAWMVYKCREIMVVAREASRCYASLPVELEPADYRMWKGVRGQSTPKNKKGEEVPNPPGEHFFIEPHTHKLTTVGIIQECRPGFPALYETAYGQWLAVTPQVNLAPEPKSLVVVNKLTVGPPPDWGIAGGGLYDAKMMAAWERSQQMPVTKIDLQEKAAAVAIQGGYDPESPIVRARSLYPELAWSGMGPMAMIWYVLKIIGQVTSILMGLFMCYKIIAWLGDVGSRCIAMKGLEGCGSVLWDAFKPPTKITREARTAQWMTARGYRRRPGTGEYYKPDSDGEDGPFGRRDQREGGGHHRRSREERRELQPLRGRARSMSDVSGGDREEFSEDPYHHAHQQVEYEITKLHTASGVGRSLPPSPTSPSGPPSYTSQPRSTGTKSKSSKRSEKREDK